MAKLSYAKRALFHGNRLLTIGDLTEENKIKNVILATGLVSVGAMEDEAEVKNFAADDVADHATIAGKSLLKGELKLIQLDKNVRINFFGQDETANGFGFGSTNIYPKKAVQIVTAGQVGNDKAILVRVFPNMAVTNPPSFETETDSSEAPTAVTWTAKVQATGSELYKTKNGHTPAEFNYTFTGADVDKVLDFIQQGGIITPNYKTTDTVAADAAAPVEA